MTDDVEETLASLEQRLRALQSELDAEADEPFAPPVASPSPVREEPTDFFSGTVALEARTDLAGLAALHRGLRRVAGVRGVTLRSYADGQATLDVTLERFG